MKISELLLTGRVNALPLRHLKDVTGLPGRTIRQMIEAERRMGTPICSDNATGYFMPANDAERAAFVASMRGRAGEILRTAKAVECGGGDLPGQIEIGVEAVGE